MMIHFRARRTAVLGLACALLALLLAHPPPAQALPPRPNPSPPAPAPTGAAIELRLWTRYAVDLKTMETAVQWQDGLGAWHDVESWHGSFDQLYTDGGRKTWYVSGDQFGSGPYRWVLWQQGEQLAASDPFEMPTAAGQTVRTLVTLSGTSR